MTLNSTPKTLSRLMISDAGAGGTRVRATFWMSSAARLANSVR